MQVKDCMSKNICYCNTEDLVASAAKLMCENHIGCIPVCNNEQNVVGIITDRDIILRSIACDKDVKQTPVTEIMTTSVCCCNTDSDIQEATKMMKDLQVRRLPVLENNKIVGMLSIGDLVNAQNVNEQEVSDTIGCICNCKSNKNAE